MRPKAEALGYLEAWPARLSCRDEHPDLQVREIGGTRFGYHGFILLVCERCERTAEAKWGLLAQWDLKRGKIDAIIVPSADPACYFQRIFQYASRGRFEQHPNHSLLNLADEGSGVHYEISGGLFPDHTNC